MQVRAVGKASGETGLLTQQLLVPVLRSERKDGFKYGGVAELKLVNKWLEFVTLEFTHAIPGLFLVVRSTLYLIVCRCEPVTPEVDAASRKFS